MVSIVIPNYNHAQYLEQRINSVLSQTYTDFEIIILDDCSSDNSQDVIEKFRYNKKVSKIIFNKVNSGSPFLQWELGLKHAKGKYIWIAESDDISASNFLEEAVSKFIDEPKLILSTCRTYHIDECGKIIAPNTWGEEINPSLWHTDFKMNGIDLISNYLIYKNVIPNASSVVFRNDVSNEIRFLNEIRWKFCGDWFFWFLILKKGDFAYNSKYLNFQRSSGDNTRSKKSFDLEKIRYQEAIKIVNLIIRAINVKRRFSDNDFSWIHQTYLERVSFLKKISYDYWKLDIPRKAILALFAKNLTYHRNIIQFKIQYSLKSIFVK